MQFPLQARADVTMGLQCQSNSHCIPMVTSARACYENCIEFSLLYENYAINNVYTSGCTISAKVYPLQTHSVRNFFKRRWFFPKLLRFFSDLAHCGKAKKYYGASCYDIWPTLYFSGFYLQICMRLKYSGVNPINL